MATSNQDLNRGPQGLNQAIVTGEYKTGVLGFLYQDWAFSMKSTGTLGGSISARAAGLAALTEGMTEMRANQQDVFKNMFAADQKDIPIEDGLRGSHSADAIANMAAAWLGLSKETTATATNNGTILSAPVIQTSQGTILLRYRPPAVKDNLRTATHDVYQANLEIQVKPTGANAWTTIVNLHVTRE